MNAQHIFQGCKASIACIAAAATLMAGGVLNTPAASALEIDGQYYSSKQPYVAPDAETTANYSKAPEGYETVYTESMARHGSRGLSSYKYDALLMKMAEAADKDNGFKSDAIKNEFVKNLTAITAANVQNGYGMLTGQGANQHQGIGTRAYERNKALFDKAAQDGGKIAYQSSGEARATESGENFARGFNTASNNELANSTVNPADPAGTGEAAVFDKTPNTLYFHKAENPDGTEKTGDAKKIADDYQNFVENDQTIAGAEETISENADVMTASHDLLSQIFTDDFLAKLADGTYKWYNTADGTKNGDVNCAPGADPSKDADACGEAKKKIASEYDAAMDLYNLYIIAADMQNENTGSHTFDFNQYFQGQQASDARLFAWALDAEDFYEKGPSYTGQDETYKIAQPLLDDFFNTIDQRVNGGSTVATFRFAHAETIMPFAALLGLPGSTQQAPASTTDVYTYDNNEWRGESVTPMAANVQWDVAVKPGNDPKTGRAYTPLVRMLYNEKEIPFRSECTPIADGSTWYKLTELKSCLEAGHQTTGDNAKLQDGSNPLVGLVSEFGTYWQAPQFNDDGTLKSAGKVLNKQVLAENDEKVVAINNKAAEGATDATPSEQQQRALSDRDADKDVATAFKDGFGPVIGEYFAQGYNDGSLDKVAAVMNNNGWSGNPAKNVNQSPRPYVSDRSTWAPIKDDATGLNQNTGSNDLAGLPTSLDIIKVNTDADGKALGSDGKLHSPDYPKNSYEGSFPSGHTNKAYSRGVVLAVMVPQLAPEILARTSEAGNNRIVLGVHYPLDVMAGRIGGQSSVAAYMNANADEVAAASEQLTTYLASRCKADGLGDTLEQCIDNTGAAADKGYANAFTDEVSSKPVTDRASAIAAYQARMTYGFTQVTAGGKAFTAPEGASALLRYAYPSLTDEQRNAVLAKTAIDSGYPLDASSQGWQRIDLATALSAKVTLNKAGEVIAVAAADKPSVIVSNETVTPGDTDQNTKPSTQDKDKGSKMPNTGVAVTGVAAAMVLLALAGISLSLWKVRR
ncbi:histidine-type phosphatase [Bifidobacterium reuteri]|uniref:Multiple inositol polyphosphate phosphatase 1 n=2 Tax=Bifidobacterium TaxID=1678 RepID=A0A5J5E596_9BIFI|nr:histidine-type phosphatase [Bifidobacterium reuteri]